MADDLYIAGNSQEKLAYEEKLFRETLKADFFGVNGMSGSDYNSVIHVDNEFTSMSGYEKQMQLVYELDGEGVEEGQTLEGNEEALRYDDNKVQLKRYRHAVKGGTFMQNQRVFWSIDNVSREKLGTWLTQKNERLKFQYLQDGVTNKVFGNGKANRAALTATDTLDSKTLRKMRIVAETGGQGKFNPMKPINVMGGNYYVLLIHPDQEFDLFEDATFRESLKYGLQRSSDHPLLTNALAVTEGLAIFSTRHIELTSNGGGGAIPTAKSLLLGAGALYQLNGKRGSIISKKFDFDEEVRHAIDLTVGYEKPKFKVNDKGNAKDWGVMSFETARTDISDIVKE